MDFDSIPGETVSFELSLTSTTATAIKVYRAAAASSGNPVEITSIPASQRLLITDFAIVCAAAALVEFFCDNDGDGAVDDGERIAGGPVAANAIFGARKRAVYACNRGTIPKLKSSTADQVYLTGTGKLVREIG